MKRNILSRLVALVTLLSLCGIANAQINYNSQNCHANGLYSSAIGDGCISRSNYSFAGGRSSFTGYSSESSFSFGHGCVANGRYSKAMGYNAVVSYGTGSTAIGNEVTVNSSAATAIGTYITVNRESIAIGRGMDNTDRMLVDRNGVIALGFNSNLPTMTIFSAPGKNNTGKVAIGNVTSDEPGAKLHIAGCAYDEADILLQSQGSHKAAVCFQSEENKISVATDSNIMNFTAGGFSFNTKDTMSFSSNSFSFNPTGKVEINGILQVNKSIILTELAGDTARRVVCANGEGRLSTVNMSSFNDNMGSHVAEKNIRLNGFKLVNIKDDGGIFLDANNNVGIGTLTPSHRLSVNGTILAKELIVSKLDEDWPDYVFDPGYSLTSLEELGSYVRSERHLPGVPSAKEIDESGVKVGEMNAILLQKVEELTLYVIELQRQINELKGESK